MKLLNYFKRHRNKTGEEILRDTEGEPFVFFRGGEINNIKNGVYFCNSIVDAIGYAGGVDDNKVLYRANICTIHPLIIDATCNGGFYYYDTIKVERDRFFPKELCDEFIQSTTEKYKSKYVSTDEILEWAIEKGCFDSVIIKNVREGMDNKKPIYDIMVWDGDNLVNLTKLSERKIDIKDYMQYMVKRIELYKFCGINEQRGLLAQRHKKDHSLECWIELHDVGYELDNRLVFKMKSNKSAVFCNELKDYIYLEKISDGEYLYRPKRFGEQIIEEDVGTEIIIHGINSVLKNFVIKNNIAV